MKAIDIRKAMELANDAISTELYDFKEIGDMAISDLTADEIATNAMIVWEWFIENKEATGWVRDFFRDSGTVEARALALDIAAKVAAIDKILIAKHGSDYYNDFAWDWEWVPTIVSVLGEHGTATTEISDIAYTAMVCVKPSYRVMNDLGIVYAVRLTESQAERELLKVCDDDEGAYITEDKS